MERFLVREITRRNPFRVEKVPWIARIYASPFERWRSLGQQALFGAPNFLTFLLYRKLSPLKPKGRFRLQSDGGEKIVKFNALNTQFSALYSRAFSAGYEPQITALIDALASMNIVFYDIGSNWGWFSLVVASKPGFQGTVHAFEPLPASFRDLTDIVNQADLSQRVRCHNVALSDQEGTTAMHLPDRFQSGRAAMDSGSASGTIPTRRLDSMDLPKPSVIKIDVEGAELRVLRGATNTLSSAKPMIVLENGRCFDDVTRTLAPLQFLRDLDYDLYHVGWLRTANGQVYFLGDDSDPHPQHREQLSLVRFDLKERFLHADAMNVFACHKDAVGKLETMFRPYEGKVP